MPTIPSARVRINVHNILTPTLYSVYWSPVWTLWSCDTHKKVFLIIIIFSCCNAFPRSTNKQIANRYKTCWGTTILVLMPTKRWQNISPINKTSRCLIYRSNVRLVLTSYGIGLAKHFLFACVTLPERREAPLRRRARVKCSNQPKLFTRKW